MFKYYIAVSAIKYERLYKYYGIQHALDNVEIIFYIIFHMQQTRSDIFF